MPLYSRILPPGFIAPSSPRQPRSRLPASLRFPLIVEALARLRSRSCIIDGEAVACGDDGIACFELIRRWDSDQSVFMWTFDLIELDGADMRREPLTRPGRSGW